MDTPATTLCKQGANSRMEKAVKSKNKLGLPGLVYKFEMICLWGT